MKKQILFYTSAIAFVFVTLSGCQTDKTSNFTSRKYTRFDNRQQAINIQKPTSNTIQSHRNETTPENTQNNRIDVIDYSHNQTTAINNNEILATENNFTIPSTSIVKYFTSKAKSKNEIIVTKKESVKSRVNNNKNENSKAYDPLLLIILAIFLPPVAVYLVKGLCGTFWLTLIFSLTLFFYPVAMVIALITVVKNDSGSRGNDQRRSGAN